MLDSVKNEIENIIKKEKLNCSIEEFKDKVNWYSISKYQNLSENFIREFKDKVHWENVSQYQTLSENFIRKFKNFVDWDYISQYQKLSENFIKEFQYKIKWTYISEYQQLSENFIRKFKNKVDWNYISENQKLSENFIREFQDKIEWECMSSYQQLSESFIREFQDKVDWDCIYQYQNLSQEFINEFKDEIDVNEYNEAHKTLTYEEKLKEVKEYCEKYNLIIDENNKCFYAYRDHDKYNRGIFNKTISYEKNKYYRDWHLDMRKDVVNSFGLGIFSKGNTKVKVLIDDWGVSLKSDDHKCRVWGFEIID